MPRSSQAALNAHFVRIKALAAGIPGLSGEKTSTAESVAAEITREVDAVSRALKRQTPTRTTHNPSQSKRADRT